MTHWAKILSRKLLNVNFQVYLVLNQTFLLDTLKNHCFIVRKFKEKSGNYVMLWILFQKTANLELFAKLNAI